MEYVYIVVDEDGKAYPNAFKSYEEALDEVKITQDRLRDTNGYPDWRDNDLNCIEVKECHKVIQENRLKDPHVTELYIEKGIFIQIYRVSIKIDLSLDRTR